MKGAMMHHTFGPMLAMETLRDEYGFAKQRNGRLAGAEKDEAE